MAYMIDIILMQILRIIIMLVAVDAWTFIFTLLAFIIEIWIFRIILRFYKILGTLGDHEIQRLKMMGNSDAYRRRRWDFW